HILGPEINQTTSDPGPNQNRNPKRKQKKTSPHPTNRKQKLSGHRDLIIPGLTFGEICFATTDPQDFSSLLYVPTSLSQPPILEEEER
ncbi:unnamed protein product, partial [Gulo gulo]